MHFVLKIEGGFAHIPGISKETTLDTKDLPEAKAEELKTCVQRCNFFDLPEEPPPSDARDSRTYILTVRRGDTVHTVRVREPVEDKHLKTLIESLRSHGNPRQD